MKTKKYPYVVCFGDAVVRVGKKARMSTKELVRRTGVSLTRLKTIEDGTAAGNDFGLAEICKIAVLLGVRPSELMGIYDANLKKSGERR